MVPFQTFSIPAFRGHMGRLGWAGASSSSLWAKLGLKIGQASSLSQTYSQFIILNLSNVQVFGLWKEIGKPGRNP